MEKDLVEEIVKKLKWHEKIIIRIFRKLFIKVYKIGITFGYNNK